MSTRTPLLKEPANSRVWVSSIANDSFGGVREIVKAWTPNARGVFTDDLNRAQHQLAAGFEAKSSAIAPVSSGTDILGGLWRMKALFEQWIVWSGHARIIRWLQVSAAGKRIV